KIECTPGHKFLARQSVDGVEEWTAAHELPERLCAVMTRSNAVVWQPVLSVEQASESVTVYDLTVDEDHSFVANGYVVSNCQAFSTAGKRHKGWGTKKRYEHGAEQCNETLFGQWLRLLRGLRPKTFVVENVSGLVKGTAKGMFLEILAEMKAAGYRVSAKLLDAQWLGVPQMRQRVIFVGVREDLADAADGTPLQPCHPAPLPFRYSVLDALPWLVSAQTSAHGFTKEDNLSLQKLAPSVPAASGGTAYTGHQVEGDRPGEVIQEGLGKHAGRNKPRGYDESVRKHGGTDGPAPTVSSLGMGAALFSQVSIVQQQGAPGASQAQQFILSNTVELESDMTGQATGVEFDRMGGPGTQSDKYFQLVRPALDDSCPTVTAAGGNAGLASVCHPTERRKFSIAELRRICAFSDDFVLTGSYAQQWERLGNSVPPIMMAMVAREIRDKVLFRALGKVPWEHEAAFIKELVACRK
ncbi:MAG: DNA cytosine methyltransferase, partial [Terracidiphilus sp.]